MKKLLILCTLATLAAPASAVKGPIPPGGFKSCKAANAAGYWDIKRGEPAYSKRLDRDGDGLACERTKRH
ncbi:excalibur calcium-binding domain-containing protein [Deinococcus sp. S9]|uniref:excalibur calcium-binding domain-containing protein n=1 Tax=Deinococcus sp. S9 TaxID=2545754 RepID=UPI001054F6F4|nr:excalibur calcium-binding domain-containing protein [Deinococcus sp. S9]TDE85321.1 excalibur calcium-binding domain-containing protein [Deinococcus sp. S9]